METADRNAAKSGPFKTEYNDYTALQLALVTPNQSVGTVKALFGRDVNHGVTENSTGNNILHLAAKYSTDINVLEYVLKNARLDIFARNNEGDTALTLCQSVGNSEGVTIINQCQDCLDDSAKKTDELMAELVNEDEKNERIRQRKKEKKQRSKLQKLADAENCSIEELQEIWKEREQKKIAAEKEQERLALEAERAAEEAIQREKEERIAELQRQRDEYEAEVRA